MNRVFLTGHGSSLMGNFGSKSTYWLAQNFLRTALQSEILLQSFFSPFFAFSYRGQTCTTVWRCSLPTNPFLLSFIGIFPNKFLTCLILFWHLLLKESKLTHVMKICGLHCCLVRARQCIRVWGVIEQQNHFSSRKD